MSNYNLQPRMLNNNEIYQKRFEQLKKMPMYKDINDFFEGMFTGFDEGDFDSGVDMNKSVFYAGDDGQCRFLFFNELGKEPTIHVSFWILDKPTKETSILSKGYTNVYNSTILGLTLNKSLFLDNKKVGRMEFYSNRIQDAKLDYDFGKDFGEKTAELCTLFKDGIHKEIFDSVVTYLFIRYNNSKSKSKGKLDIRCGLSSDASKKDDLQVSIAGANYEQFLYNNKSPELITYRGIDFSITPDFLENLSRGLLDKKSGKKRW